MIEFKEAEFKRFTNTVNPNKYYYFSEKELNNHTVEVNAGRFKVFFKIEIKNSVSHTTIARGGYKSLNDLNNDLKSFVSLNAL